MAGEPQASTIGGAPDPDTPHHHTGAGLLAAWSRMPAGGSSLFQSGIAAPRPRLPGVLTVTVAVLALGSERPARSKYTVIATKCN